VRLLVIGAGGHAKVVIDAARSAGHEVIGVVGDRAGRTELLGIEISHDWGPRDGADGFIVGIGDNVSRAQRFAHFLEAGLTPVSVVHPSAVIADQVELGAGTFVAAGAIVNIDASIGANAIINTGCTIDHDCVIGDHALIGPNASLCGAVVLGAGALVGAGATLTPGASVGEWATLGAGAVVVGALPARSVSVGIPARVVRTSGDSA